MNITTNPFGGVLVTGANGSFAVNGGGSPEEMEKACLRPGHPLTALILTSEHLVRSRNAALFAQKHHIPIPASSITQCKMRLQKLPLIAGRGESVRGEDRSPSHPLRRRRSGFSDH